MYEKTIEPVAVMHTGFGEKFGIPRQSGLVPEAAGQIVFEPKYRNSDALLQDFQHIGLAGIGGVDLQVGVLYFNRRRSARQEETDRVFFEIPTL